MRGAVGKRFNKKMTDSFDVDSRRGRVFIRIGFAELTKNFCFETPCVKFLPL